MNKFREGQRVILPANVEEGWPEERGTVLGGDDGVYVVRVDVYGSAEDPDGLREVSEEDMRAE